ncbi:hypothetical protein QE152_g4930 [Popillia japonica]|uniref:Retrovirus-related Pol polyprotein from transposon TNT 1-94-like beta-barrel domain-containing protein n=1 Tax=Popillia japonica TaxID=7064 RepID=A0AAW1MRN6_POPJA
MKFLEAQKWRITARRRTPNNDHTGSNVAAEELVEAGVDIEESAVGSILEVYEMKRRMLVVFDIEESAVGSILEVYEMKRRMLVVFVQKLRLDHKVVLKLIIVLCNSIEWILDSGCSDHIINNDKYFSDFVELKKPVNVKVGDGRCLKATKIGNVIHNFNVFGKKVAVM